MIKSTIKRIIRGCFSGLSITVGLYCPTTSIIGLMCWMNSIILSPPEIALIRQFVLSKNACRFLVFGLGNDSVYWHKMNKRGITHFLEDNSEWNSKVVTRYPYLNCTLITYHTQRHEWRSLLNQPDKLYIPLPDEVLQDKWDVILVDAPAGNEDLTPGRMQSIFMAAKLAKVSGHCEIFVHDCHREVESTYSDRFLGPENLIKQIDNLRHYQTSQPRVSS